MVKKKEIGVSLKPGYSSRTDTTGKGQEDKTSYYKSEAKTSDVGKEGEIIKFKNQQGIDKSKVETIPTFIPEEKKSDEERITSQIESGKIDTATGSKLLEGVSTEQTMTPQEQEDKTFLDKVAQIGMIPSVMSANIISTELKWLTGIDMGKVTTEHMVENTKFGKALGLATVGTAAVLGFKMAFPVTAGKVGLYGKAGFQGAGISAKQVGVSSELISKMSPATKVGVIKKAQSFLWKNKGVVGAVTGVQLLSAWLSSDNIISASGIYARDVERDLIFGNVTPSEATDILNGLQETKDTGTFFMKTAVYTNPLLWLFAKAYITNANQVQEQIDRAKARANSL